MRSKLVALAALLFFFALLEYRLAPRPSTASPSRAKDMVRRLLPTASCNFELTGRWQSNLDQHTVEAITSYLTQVEPWWTWICGSARRRRTTRSPAGTYAASPCSGRFAYDRAGKRHIRRLRYRAVQEHARAGSSRGHRVLPEWVQGRSDRPEPIRPETVDAR